MKEDRICRCCVCIGAWYWLIRLELVLFAVSAGLFLLRSLQGCLLWTLIVWLANVSNCVHSSWARYGNTETRKKKTWNFSQHYFRFRIPIRFHICVAHRLIQKHLQTHEELSAARLITKALLWSFLTIPKSFIHPHRFDRWPSKSLTISSVFFSFIIPSIYPSSCSLRLRLF